MPTRSRKAVFLDRDGILNDDVGFPHRVGDAELLPDVIPSLLRLQAAGIKLIVVSNQSGIARGYFSTEEVERFNLALATHLANAGIDIGLDDFYYCPHGPGDDCPCRKPRPGLIHRATTDHGLDLTRSVLIGDRATDIQAGVAAGTRTILLNRATGASAPACDAVVGTLPEAADLVLDWLVE